MELSMDITNLIVRYAFNFIVAFIIIKVVYQKDNNNKDFIFTYFMFNSLIFFFAFILGSVEINMGFAFGLFAVFAILRYRTDPIPIKEMTYLFTVITVGVINALSAETVSYQAIIFTNSVIVILAYVLEKYWRDGLLIKRSVEYENIENIKPENHSVLLEDLKERTGLNIEYFEIQTVNFLRDTVKIKIFSKN
tara:strand:+ start:199 stop:777 length:579 start_codon:yes stop_codon:yes gene_type:complete